MQSFKFITQTQTIPHHRHKQTIFETSKAENPDPHPLVSPTAEPAGSPATSEWPKDSSFLVEPWAPARFDVGEDESTSSRSIGCSKKSSSKSPRDASSSPPPRANSCSSFDTSASSNGKASVHSRLSPPADESWLTLTFEISPTLPLPTTSTRPFPDPLSTRPPSPSSLEPPTMLSKASTKKSFFLHTLASPPPAFIRSTSVPLVSANNCDLVIFLAISTSRPSLVTVPEPATTPPANWSVPWVPPPTGAAPFAMAAPFALVALSCCRRANSPFDSLSVEFSLNRREKSPIRTL
ncbi:unnamed protein product [Ectocarpus fasciculatus]